MKLGCIKDNFNNCMTWFHKKTQVSLNTKHCAQRKTEKLLKLAPKIKIKELIYPQAALLNSINKYFGVQRSLNSCPIFVGRCILVVGQQVHHLLVLQSDFLLCSENTKSRYAHQLQSYESKTPMHYYS